MKPASHLKTQSSQNFLALHKEFPSIDLKTNEKNCSEFSNGFCYKEFLFETTDQELRMEIAHKEGFYFIFCWKGRLTLEINQSSQLMESFQSALIFNRNSEKVILKLEKFKTQEFCVISFNRPIGDKNFVQNLFYKRFKDSFCSQISESTYFYVGPPYLKLLDKMNQISKMSKGDLAGELIMQGIILLVLGLKMEQILESISAESSEYVGLTKMEIEALQSVSTFIENHPEMDYSIDFLCRKTGLSPSKLQDGFKKIHDRTVIDYIRNVRLEKSLELIKTTELNISEIVYSIGLTSRSYFSKIFKNKYKFSPKVLQERYRRLA